jgi:hypothetical protein
MSRVQDGGSLDPKWRENFKMADKNSKWRTVRSKTADKNFKMAEKISKLLVR